MGHHASYCAVTHVPIRSRCVAIWTESKGKHYDPYYGEDAATLFLRGESDTYGGIEPDEDQKLIMDNLTEAQMENRPSLFIDEMVYDRILSLGMGKFGDSLNAGTVNENGDISIYNLLLLGFKLQDYKSDIERYTRVLIHPDYPNIEVFSDGTWSRLKITTDTATKRVEHIYTPKELAKYFTGINLEPLNICNVLNNVNKALEKLEIKEREIVFENGQNQELKDVKKELLAYYKGDVCRNLGITPQLLDMRRVIPDINQQIANVLKVRNFMQVNCLRFGLQFKGGVQEGNRQAHKELCKMMVLAHKNNK